MKNQSIHFVGVGGVGMGTLAVALSEYGYRVTGSDKALYEPMKSVLANASVEFMEGYEPSNVEKAKADRVVIGNVTRKENPEVQAWLQSGIDFVSFPEAVRHYLIQDKKSIVCSGTHGKTSTTSWIAFLLKELQADPTYLIGGVPRDLDRGCRVTDGDYFVGEGDEYDSAFFDKGPKFLHYNPYHLIIANIEFDHADIYRDLEHVKSSFEKVIALLPGNGLCIAHYDDPTVMELVWNAVCPVQTFGVGPGAMWRMQDLQETSQGFDFEVLYKNRSVGRFQTPMFGEHNLRNILSGIVSAANLGFELDAIRPIVNRFHGARRRQEVLMTEPFVLVDDFAHHPTEVAATLSAVRRRYADKKIWAFFEPRSATSRRRTHQEGYSKAFGFADEVMIAAPYRAAGSNPEEEFSPKELVDSLKASGKSAAAYDSVQPMADRFAKEFRPGDIAVVMSNGEFDKIQDKLKKAIL